MEFRGRNRKDGSVLIVALLICAMGAIGITAWVSVLNARSGQVDQLETGAARRIRAENGRAAAREYFYRQVVTKTAGTAHTESLPGGWGSFTLAAWGGGSPFASTAVGVVNQFSPSPYACFTKDFAFTINDGVSNLNHTFQVRSRSPLLAGDVFSLHRPTLTPASTVTISGNINVAGRAVIWPSEPGSNIDDLDADRVISPDVASATLLLDNPSGGLSMPLNYPTTATTNAEYGGPAYDGQLNVVNGATAANSMLAKMGTPVVVDGGVNLPWTNGVRSDGTGVVYFDLDQPALAAVEVRNAWRIYLYGQTSAAEATAAAAMNPVTIVCDRTNLSQFDLFSLRILDRNSRPLNLGLKKAVGGAEVWFYYYGSGSNPLWRMMTTLENTPVRLINMYGGTVTLQGGIRTDQSLRHTGWYTVPGAFNIVRETAPGNLETGDVRTAWIESYWQ